MSGRFQAENQWSVSSGKPPKWHPVFGGHFAAESGGQFERILQPTKGFGYTYDAVNRLTTAFFGENPGSTWEVNNKFSMPYIVYDDNGNIRELQRWGLCGPRYELMDLLVYWYDGNHIVGVNDPVNNYYGFQDNGHFYPNGGIEYFYDANGNLIKDLNKGILSITYNHLNLPTKIEFENNRRIYYLYDANGNKLKKTYYEDNRLMSTTDYSGLFVYKDGHIDYFLTSEGRMKRAVSGIYNAEYFIKDHLGNVRVVVSTVSGPSQITDYYPFGLEIPVTTSSDNKLKYNAKELQTEAKLDWYDYGARFYDPVLGRWHSVDPMAETSRRWSPYTYCMNNPIRFIDPDGMNTDVYITGEAAEDATKQLEQSTSLQLSRDSQTGKITASGDAKTKSDKQLLAAINDKTIDVNITATNSLQTSTGYDYSGGAFMGNEISENTSTLEIPEVNLSIELSSKTVEASQEVNPNMLEYYDNAAGTKGAFMKHEVTEAYEGAKKSLSTGISALPAFQGNATYNSIYLPAHNAASRQPAISSSDVNNARNYAVAKPLMKNMLHLLNIIK